MTKKTKEEKEAIEPNKKQAVKKAPKAPKAASMPSPSDYGTVKDIEADDSLSQRDKDYLIAAKDPAKRKYKWGRITDEEGRFIERNLPLSNYKDIAAQLNRRPDTVRKWAQKNGISVDKISRKKTVLEDIKKDQFFKQLDAVLTQDEILVSHEVYLEMCNQFGNDIKYSERHEIIDFCIVSALLFRELAKEKKIDELIYGNQKKKETLKQQKEALLNSEEDDSDYQDTLEEQLDEIEYTLADLKDERKETKSRQDKLIDRKKNARSAMNASRAQRREHLNETTKNFGSLMSYLQKNPEFRRDVGYEMEKMKLGVNAEWARLSEAFKYADGSIDYPLLSSEVVQKEIDKQGQIIESQTGKIDTEIIEEEDENNEEK